MHTVHLQLCKNIPTNRRKYTKTLSMFLFRQSNNRKILLSTLILLIYFKKIIVSICYKKTLMETLRIIFHLFDLIIMSIEFKLYIYITDKLGLGYLYWSIHNPSLDLSVKHIVYISHPFWNEEKYFLPHIVLKNNFQDCFSFYEILKMATIPYLIFHVSHLFEFFWI